MEQVHDAGFIENWNFKRVKVQLKVVLSSKTYLEGNTHTSHPWVQQVQHSVFGLDFPSNPLHNIHPIAKLGLHDGSLPGQQLHEYNPKAVDITLLIHLQGVCILCRKARIGFGVKRLNSDIKIICTRHRSLTI
jgi:hypothetical protein